MRKEMEKELNSLKDRNTQLIHASQVMEGELDKAVEKIQVLQQNNSALAIERDEAMESYEKLRDVCSEQEKVI